MSLTTTIDAPATNYFISIREVRESSSKLFSLERVGSIGGGGDAITAISDTAPVNTSGKQVIHLIEGKSWGWGDNTATVIFIQSAAELPAEWNSAHVVWTNPNPDPAQQKQAHEAAHGGRYIVLFNADKATYRTKAEELIKTFQIPTNDIIWFDFISAYTVTLSASQAAQIGALDFIKSIEKDG